MELQIIQDKIHEIRGKRIMLDFDLAEMYEVETRALKQAVRRNINRFPKDFMFELTKDEYNSLTSQIVTLKKKGRGQHRKYMPFAFTEQGVSMLASVLKSDIAVQISISIIRAFVLMRQHLADYKDLQEKINTLQKNTIMQFNDIYQVLNVLLDKNKESADKKERKQIGYK
ncbi:MAG: ORF6N domain-containing protein [Flavobacteriaceae bacterium]|nr:ORF6N domain-containing protein [Flavobacteriaceae bacterium]